MDNGKQTQVKLMKNHGYSDSTVASVLNVSTGEIERATRHCELDLQKALRLTEKRGHYRVSPFGDFQVPKIVQKSSVSKEEPEVMLKARELLSLGLHPDEVCAQAGCTRMDLSKWLGTHWRGIV